MNIG
ncbi:hypothetical protein YPPY54_1485, partial [Yersinia pestis PY-54]